MFEHSCGSHVYQVYMKLQGGNVNVNADGETDCPYVYSFFLRISLLITIRFSIFYLIDQIFFNFHINLLGVIAQSVKQGSRNREILDLKPN